VLPALIDRRRANRLAVRKPFGLAQKSAFNSMSHFNSAVALLKGKRVAALFFLIAVPTCAFAKDLELLAKLLSGSFLAQQGVAICSTGDVPFSSEDLLTISKLNSHVDYMKSRITESLLVAEQMAVLREAADRAKAQMSEVIRLLKSNPPDLEQAKRIK
jgi:hypothetical protein